MKHITKAMNLSQPSTPETERPLDSTRAMMIWVQLAELFGKAFYRENSESPPKLWIQAIHRLTDQQIARGLANLGNDDLKFPPNLSMFIAACKREKPVRQLGVKLLPMSDTDKKLNEDKAWADMERLAGRKLRP